MEGVKVSDSPAWLDISGSTTNNLFLLMNRLATKYFQWISENKYERKSEDKNETIVRWKT